MNSRDRLLAVAVALLWGCNFIAIDFGLRHFPPLFFAGLRFAVIAVVAVLFVPLPKVEWRWLIGYGIGFGALQFGFLFIALHIGMPNGLASLVLQSSAPFTVMLSALLLRERLRAAQVLGISLAVLGMVVIGWNRAQNAAFLPVALTLLGALNWAFANLCARRANPPRPLHFTLWMTVVPPLPLFAVSAMFEGAGAGWRSVGTSLSSGEGLQALAALSYIVLLATILASGVWNTLLTRNPASSVAPFSLLVPVIGFTAAWLVLDEQPAPVELAAGAIVVSGVLLGSLRRPKPALPRPPEPARAKL